jgi:hypothetical protein
VVSATNPPLRAPLLHADAGLAQRLENAELWGGRRFTEAILKLDPKIKADSISVAGGSAVFMGAGHPLTQALGIGMDGPVTPAQFRQMEEFFFSRKAAAQVVICPFSDGSLLDFIQRSNYRIDHFENALYRPLLPEDKFPVRSDSFVLERTRPEHYEEAAWLQARCFFREQAGDFLPLSWASFLMDDSVSYVAWVEGKMAAMTGGILLRDLKLASLFGSSTLSEYRGRGLQTAMLQARLSDAVAAGCDLAFIGAMPGSITQRNAERLGFRVAYSKVIMVRDCPNS